MRKTALILMLSLLMAACSRHQNDYAAFSDVDSDGWAYGHSFLYLPQTEDSVVQGSLMVAVRHTNDYPYRNLWLEVTSQAQTPDSAVAFRVDTLNMQLADPAGVWFGSGLGVSFQKSDTVVADFTLLSGAPIRVRHIMRAEKVPGLEQVGIIFKAK